MQPRNSTRLIVLMASFSLAACGAFQDKKIQKEETASPQDPAVAAELISLISKYLTPDSYFKVKRSVTKSNSGVVTQSKSYKYQGDDVVSEIMETFSSSGTLESRNTALQAPGACGEYLSKSEYFGAEPRTRIWRTTYKCNNNGNVIESHHYTQSDNKPEEESSVTNYEFDSTGKHTIKKTVTYKGASPKVETTVKKFDSQGDEIEALESTDGKPTERKVTDKSAGTEVVWTLNPATQALDVEKEYIKLLPAGRRPLFQMLGMSYSMAPLAEYRSRSNDESVEGSCQMEGDLAKCHRSFKDLKSGQITKSTDYTLEPIFIADAARLIGNLAWSQFVNSNRIIVGYSIKTSSESEFKDGKLVSTELVTAEFNSVGIKISEQTNLTKASGETTTTLEKSIYDQGGFRPLQVITTGSSLNQTVTYEY